MPGIKLVLQHRTPLKTSSLFLGFFVFSFPMATKRSPGSRTILSNLKGSPKTQSPDLSKASDLNPHGKLTAMTGLSYFAAVPKAEN
jgi:hypothetical protein